VKAFGLQGFIDAHRHELQPPVGNARVFDDGDFIVMAVGGPNRRRDYHLDPGDELFYQLEGDIVLRVMQDGQPKDLPILQGQMLLLPAGVPHSPQRPAGTVGLVVERRRRPEETDGFRWYCDACGGVVHERFFALTDITTQIRETIEAWEASDAIRTCPDCGTLAPAR
jgi:3-hydroxyanthranilate 3,4-dioxygenase